MSIKTISENFGIDDKRSIEIVSDIASYIGFENEGVSDHDVIQYINATYTGKEVLFAFFSFGRIGQQHEMVHEFNLKSRGVIQLAFDLQQVNEHASQGDLAIDVFQKMSKVARS